MSTSKHLFGQLCLESPFFCNGNPAMEMYNISEHGNAETYMIQGTESNLHMTGPVPEQSQSMHTEGAPELIADQSMHYPNATNYEYCCTGFESPNEWEDHHRFFGIDGPDIQYVGAQNDFLSYVYYAPSYGYAQSQYNPCNPYIPGAMIGVDSRFVGAQPYYPISSYQNHSAPAFVPIVIQPEINPNSSSDSLIDPSINRSKERGLLTTTLGKFSRNTLKPSPNQINSLDRVAEGSRANSGPGKQSVTRGSLSTASCPDAASSRVVQVRRTTGSIQPINNISNGKVVSQLNHLKVAFPINSGLSGFGSSAHDEFGAIGKLPPKVGRALNHTSGCPDAYGEQNRGPRVQRSKIELSLKAYATKGGDGNTEGNIVIYADQFNKDEFPIDYVDAKFFVIKSYSEDDVHKSIKYNVWSSTPHGNKKLNNTYEDAQRLAVGKPRGCPIFLFFSVNASGQFCGVAEMIEPVDFNKDMDFWQQDKWSGSFPVKWHIIKDVSNTNFRHIILENNENKPVTNSRDTQEIMYKKGLEMLKIFKNHALKTSLLDDFMYYETRQKILLDEKAKLLAKSLKSPFLPAFNPPRKQNCVVELSQTEDKKPDEITGDLSGLKSSLISISKRDSSTFAPTDNNSLTKQNAEEIAVAIEKEDNSSTLSIGSLRISQKHAEPRPSVVAVVTHSKNTNIVAAGSLLEGVNGLSTGVLTVGTIPLDPKALRLDKKDGVFNIESQHE